MVRNTQAKSIKQRASFSKLDVDIKYGGERERERGERCRRLLRLAGKGEKVGSRVLFCQRNKAIKIF